MNLEERYYCLHDPYYKVENFWINGVLLGLINVFGIIGNVFNIIALSHLPFRNEVFYQLLLTLALFNIFLVVNNGITLCFHSMAWEEFHLRNTGYFMIVQDFSVVGLTGSHPIIFFKFRSKMEDMYKNEILTNL